MDQKIIATEVVDGLREFDSPTISNAIEHFAVRDPVDGYADMRLRCHLPGGKPMVGYAVTCTGDTTTRGDNRPMKLAEVLDAIHVAPKPAVLVIKDVGSDPLRSCFVGDMFCTALQLCGVVGVVTDGGFRDLAGIAQRAPGFQVFSPGMVVSHGYGVYLDFGVTVSICGLEIRQGDLLHGDDSGLLKVPLDIAEALPQQAQKVRETEAEYFDFLQGDSFNFDELKRRMAAH